MKLNYGDSAARKVSERIAESVSTTAALTAIPSDRRVDGMLILVAGQLYRFSSSSTATGGGILAPDSGTGKWLPIAGGAAYNTPRQVRGVVYANVANLASFTVAATDLTFVEGNRVLLTAQTTAAQCGIYVVGAVDSGTAALTRASDFATGDAIVNGMIVEVSEGTLWAGSSWKAMCTGAKVVGTDDPLFYPRNVRGTLTLTAGTKTLGSTEGLFLFSTTRSSIQVTRNTPGGTLTGTTGYQCAVANRTAGKSGTAAATVIAHIEAGTIQNQDTSTLDFTVTNW